MNKSTQCKKIVLPIVGLSLTIILLPLIIYLIVDNSGSSKMSTWETDFRIPSETYPEHYDLFLHPNLETNKFTGTVTIHLNSSQSRDFFLCHIKYLNVTKSELKTQDGNSIEIKETFEYPENEFWVVKLKNKVEAGNYQLYLEFDGVLDNGIVGFYKSIYTNANGDPKAIATSKFQPTYARRAFPCFDEPSFKSSYSISLVMPSNYISLSNMRVQSIDQNIPSQGLSKVNFEKSEVMVTYLAVFIVCDFVFKETETPIKKIPFRVYGTDVIIDKLGYAMEVGSNVADYYDEYFGIPYPLPKLYMAAIPDYSSGATEHWGMITYRETRLAYDENQSSIYDKDSVASVIAHELAHQWFGNLVTLEWWNDLWLNEGFATYMSYKGVKSYESTWDTESGFLHGDLHRVLALDATLGSHPIVVDVSTPDQINAVFDTISYSKGSSVIRMMENFMGTTDFKLGIHNFLEKYSFKNAITQDLFDELTAVSSEKLDITKIMNTWTRQKGFPVLTLEKKNNAYVMKQDRFLTDPDAYDKPDLESEYGYKWEIPVTYISSVNSEKIQEWFHLEDESLQISIPNGADWIKFNVGQYGYYRVNYPADDWKKFSDLLINDFLTFSTSDRASLINDAMSLASGNRLGYDIALEITKYLPNETQLAPWEALLSAFEFFDNVFYYTDVNPKLLKYQRFLVENLYNQLGWNDDGDYNEKMLRTRILYFACASGMTDCLKTAGSKFLEWKSTGNAISPNLKSVVYKFGMQSEGDYESWKWMFNVYMEETNNQEKLKLLNGLASITDPAVLYQFIQMGKQESIVRGQDFFTFLRYLSTNRVGESIVWDFVRDEWEYLVDRFTLNDRYLGSMIPDVTNKFATERRLNEMKVFFAKYPEAGAGEANRKIALEQVENNIKFLGKYAETISQWLNDNTK